MININLSRFNKNLKEIVVEITQQWPFWMMLVVKLGFVLCYEPQIISNLFIPFIQSFSDHFDFDVYNEFFLSGKKENFPYPAMMLYFFGFLHGCFQFIFGEHLPYTTGVLIRLTLFICDFALLLSLARLLRGKIKDVVCFYWLSPAVFFMIYIHGQLDVLPMTMLFISIYFLFKDKIHYSSIFLGIAISCKINILLVLPLYAIYLLSRNTNWGLVLRHIAIVVGTFILINLPFLGSTGFLQMVFNNKEQFKIFNASITNKDYEIYLTPLFYIALLMKAWYLKGYSKDIYVSLIGFAFGIILFFVSPSPGWYFWVLPFFIFSLVKFSRNLYPLLLLFQFLIISFFLLRFNPELLSRLGEFSQYLVNINFTLMQTILVCLCVIIYRNSIQALADHKIISRPFMIGIGGDSGSGKSQISSYITDVFGHANSLILRGDDMHKWQRGHENWKKLTHLNPKANYLHDEVRYLKTLKKNKVIKRRSYDHSNGQFTSEVLIKPKSIIIFEGLHPFYLSKLRELYDLKIFIKPEPDLARHWKIVRDLTKRKYDLSKVLEQIKLREKDSLNFIYVQEKYADVVLYIYSKNKIENIGSPDENIDVRVMLKIQNKFNLEPFIELFSSNTDILVKHEYIENDYQTIEVDVSELELQDVQCASEPLMRIFDELGLGQPTWRSGLSGFLQLVFTYLILEIERDGNGI